MNFSGGVIIKGAIIYFSGTGNTEYLVKEMKNH